MLSIDVLIKKECTCCHLSAWCKLNCRLRGSCISNSPARVHLSQRITRAHKYAISGLLNTAIKPQLLHLKSNYYTRNAIKNVAERSLGWMGFVDARTNLLTYACEGRHEWTNEHFFIRKFLKGNLYWFREARHQWTNIDDIFYGEIFIGLDLFEFSNDL